ncbi:hypothetical protein H9L12_09495 [Sphingomonas rhizophila]|uniref:Uncharacterized protein n=1 Tax=Sphingomonas rhizophila TaxID=2071607 RepID=A0A7G9S9L1_9SPHN|nr:hypothetical protein [Sphingomonas rhizophila]QNN64536.1 hypothetical protein H9L12_09495 [Sphingomonas rhizophila]
MTEDDASYCRQRAITERERALGAEDDRVREIHTELARRYEAVVLRLSPKDISAVPDQPEA